MTTKKQHYVPQFLLRQFAVSGSSDRISVYRIPEDKFIPQTSVKGQAHENYFYGLPQLEKCLDGLEGKASAIIASTVTNHEVPPYLSDGYHILQAFTIIQAHRTRHAADERNEHVDKFVKTLMKNDPKLQENKEMLDNLDHVSIGLEHAAADTLAITAQNLHLANDLRCKVLHNRTSIPFVISDHPAVLYNQFLEERKPTGGITGLAAKGLQVFLPISPKHTLIFFDEWTYKVGAKRLASTRVDIVDESDIKALNLLQAANANEHIYSNGTLSDADIRRLVRKASPFRSAEKVRLTEYERHGGSGKDTLIHIHPLGLRLNLKLKCITIPPHAQRYKGDGSMLYVRNPELYNLSKAFNQAVRAGKYKADEWNKFLEKTANLGSNV